MSQPDAAYELGRQIGHVIAYVIVIGIFSLPILLLCGALVYLVWRRADRPDPSESHPHEAPPGPPFEPGSARPPADSGR